MYKRGLLLFSFCLVCLSVRATEVKIAVLVPEDSTWGESIQSFAKKVRDKTKNQVSFRVYYNGVAGDEPDILRKIRIKQMHGGVFTGRALGDINGDIRAIEVPFKFHSNRKKAWETLQGHKDFFNKGFEKNGFINLGFLEIGLIYVASRKKVKSLEELKGLKVWLWDGDRLVSTLIQTLGLTSVPLALTDVLSSLSTGAIDAVYGSPLAFLAVQWHSKVSYLIDFPVSYSIAALMLDRRQWKKISPENQKIVRAIAQEEFKKANEATVKENQEAMKTLKATGIKFVSFPETDVKQGAKIRKEVISKLSGKLFSKQAIDKVGR